jgi:hypothetical protein
MRLHISTPLLKRTILCAILTFVSIRAKNMAHSGPWSGIIINAGCTPEEAFAEAAKCTENRGPDAELTLYGDTTRKIYSLKPQDQAAGRLGESVTVHGTLEGDVIQVVSINLLTGIGLPVGRKAPPFTARDQFGHEQNLDTLKGKNGTALLFYRSADW